MWIGLLIFLNGPYAKCDNVYNVPFKVEWLAKISLYLNHYYYSLFSAYAVLVDILAAFINDGPTSSPHFFIVPKSNTFLSVDA